MSSSPFSFFTNTVRAPVPIARRWRFVARLLATTAALVALFSGTTARAAAPSGDAEALVAKAHARGLANETTWLRLGHWRPKWNGGFTSEADGDPFFLAKDGKANPAAELDATLRGFFAGDDHGDAKLDHPLCRFPARLMWLQEQLAIDLSRLPARQCPKLEHFWNRTRPMGATLVFSSYYLNNPASAFGHTFLRVNRDDPYATGERRELLDYGVDYAASVDTGNSVMYALKGLTGQFPGRFSIYPYFYKVREYNDYESRDLWEYDLSLTPQQVTMLTLHLWELGSTYFAYYYMSENCSYHILGALEVVDPKLQLLAKLKFPVVPIDTVKAVADSPGLVRSVHYRPSMRSQFRKRVEQMDESALAMVGNLIGEPNAAFGGELSGADAQVKVLDAALDLVDFRHADDILASSASEGARIKQRLMERRAQLRVPSVDPRREILAHEHPDRGHGSGRLVLGSGLSSQAGGSSYHEVGYRLALHDLSDPPAGYPELNAIEFLPFRLRFWPGVNGYRAVQLESIALINVLSLTSQNRFDRQFSWRLRVGGERLRDRGCDDCFAASAEFGGGVAFSSSGEGVSVFLLVNNSLLAGPQLDGIAHSVIRFGIGPWGGARLRWSPKLVTLATGGIDYLPLQDAQLTWFVKTTTAWMLGERVGLALDARAQPKASELQLTSRIYF